MKKGIFLPSLIGLLALSCTVQEIETQTPPYEPAPGDDVFYASLAPESDTKVHVDKIDEQIKTLWDENDQISIFNKNTVNQQYEFMGETGDNAGYFKRVSEEAVAAGNGSYVCAVYPFSQATSLDEGVLTLTLPKKQTYREGSYGLEANTMVSTTDGKNNLLRFKNVGGYLVLKFYGTQMVDGEEKAITIKSIKLEGRNGELLSGEAIMTPAIGELPIIEMAETAGTSITLDANKVKLGKNAGKATEFWMVVPPTVFSEGFLLTVTDKDNKVFTKETDQRLVIERNGVLRIAPIEVKPALPLDPDKVIYYTTSDKNVVAPAEGAGFGANIVSNDYVDLKGILAFDGSVTTIGANAFAGCETLTGMTIPSTVTSIGESAFAGCTSLGAPNTPSGADITEPTKGPNRSGETTFVIPEGVTSIGAHAFAGCTSLTSIIIPDSVTIIGDGAFEGCTNLTDINIPDTVTEMGENVFKGCTSITSVTIPDGVTSIDDYAFAGCSNLVSIDIPETVTSIGMHAFDDCENLVSINIPNGVERIEPFTFAACMALTKIKIPDGVKSIGSSAFESCFSLWNVSLPSSIEEIGNYAFAQCSSFTFFTIPSKVTQISDGLFYDCPQLSRIEIHGKVEGIGYAAFHGCTSLTSISIPSSVTRIEDEVFNGCTGLNAIIMEAINHPVTENGMEYTFVNTNDCPIFVPEGSVNAYKEANDWSQYASRIYPIYFQTGTFSDHAYMDLGVDAKWATMNVGATTSVEPGVILPWSEGKAAAEEWGGSWRLPTREEFETLMDESKFIWTLDFANYGYIITSKMAGYMGNSIFLPFADASDPTDPEWNLPGTGFFWSSTPDDSGFYYYLQIDDADVPFVGQGYHNLYFSIRPVAD
ncbi:MAG: leucine-rich repeat protein [Paludibacteraceae bacterium]|nr:leucine-rich repeat protein [Paludibacteraceae bacterium]